MTSAPLRAIAIGASAGGVQSLSRILPALPRDFPIPIMVVVHVPPDRENALVTLFQSKCRLTVKEAEDKEQAVGGVIYFAPSDYHLLVEDDGSLALSSDEPVNYSRPSIDVLFETAADSYGTGLTAIVLTGANEDGAAGLKAAADLGAHVLVEDPAGAEVSAMPAAALAACPSAQDSVRRRVRGLPFNSGGHMMDGSEFVKFLLVDDLEENLLALEALLRKDGLVFHTARSGEEALELLLVHDFALALLDVQMPGMDGFELAEFMRGNERSRHIPIIFVTAGAADVARRFRGYEAGAVDFIHKPIEADILRSKADVFFDLYDQRRQITEQRDQLAAFADVLQTADRRKNEFLAILAHELRNPIMAMAAGLKLLDLREGTEHTSEIRKGMGRHVQHLSRLIEDLLDIARIDQGKISLRTERILLQDVLAFAVEASQPYIEAARHSLVLDISSDPVWLDADHTRIAQIVSNLLGNAAKYTPAGGKILLRTGMSGPSVEIEVSDTGVGIAPGMQDKIFELFAQVKGASRSAQDGLGIGLALVKQLVELHGGTISLKRSAPDEGSTFIVQLPVIDPTNEDEQDGIRRVRFEDV